MAPGRRCMSGNTCGCRMSWTYHWAVMVSRINTRSNRVLRPGSIPLQSSFLVRETTPNGGVDERASRATHVMGAAIPNVLQPGAFVWFGKTQGLLMRVLPVPGW
ncbi:uncharacterized protein TNCV_2898031 [Trichonephila clavipes]|nr:uncharacterized protein TNCV_2898031 [Trichonephila clavipes]